MNPKAGLPGGELQVQKESLLKKKKKKSRKYMRKTQVITSSTS